MSRSARFEELDRLIRENPGKPGPKPRPPAPPTDYECSLCKATPGCHLALLPSRNDYRDHLEKIHGLSKVKSEILDACRYSWRDR